MKHENIHFPSAIQLQTPALDMRVLQWGWRKGVFTLPAELERCRIHKVNWFAGYLFPTEEQNRLEQIMRFFLCLFILDDLLDAYPETESFAFLKSLKNRSDQTGFPRLNKLAKAILTSHDALGISDQPYISNRLWLEAWDNYLLGLEWELENKRRNQMPKLEDYRIQRPYCSGVYLAIHLLIHEKHAGDCRSDLLENNIARFICLSNDLNSFEKELKQGDFHNELIILMESLAGEVKPWAVRELYAIQQRIIALARDLEQNSEICQQWVERILLLLGGCLSWAADTARYVSYVNGTVKKAK